MNQYKGKAYGGPWDGKDLAARHLRVTLVERSPVSLTPTLNEPRDITPLHIAGEYVWKDEKEEGETRGPHWTWLERSS